MTDDLSTIIPSAKVYPFPRVISNVLKHTSILECPMCLNKGNVYDTYKEAPFDLGFCEGNQPPECVHTHPLSGREHSHPVVCAGVIEKHFHVACQVCDFRFLLSIPQEAQ